MAFDTIAEIVDLDRYPLDDPDGPAVAALLAEGRAALARDALHSLPGFVRPAASDAMAAELEGLVPVASRFEVERGSYSDDGRAWPAGHPRTATHRCSYHQVLNWQIGNESPLRRLFVWEPLREFLRRLMGYETFFRSECPHLALTAKIAGAGDTDGWHFDGNDVVFSVLLRQPEAGGVFEYVPGARTDAGGDDYERVAAAFAGHPGPVRAAGLAVGDLNVFQGNDTLHRVSPVEGTGRRVVGLFCYDREPGTNFGDGYVRWLHRHMPGHAAGAAALAAE